MSIGDFLFHSYGTVMVEEPPVREPTPRLVFLGKEMPKPGVDTLLELDVDRSGTLINPLTGEPIIQDPVDSTLVMKDHYDHDVLAAILDNCPQGVDAFEQHDMDRHGIGPFYLIAYYRLPSTIQAHQ